MMVQGAKKTMREFTGNPHLGVLMNPNAKNDPKSLLKMGFPTAADNGCYSGFDEVGFHRMLGLVRSKLLWVAAPDKVGDAKTTLEMFDLWEPVIRHKYSQPVALVAQDNLTASMVPWDRIDCLFVGGTDAWKLSPGSVDLCREAKTRGKLVHGGRCNSFVRIRAFMAMGADSFDGSQFHWWPNRYIPKGIKWIKRAERDLAEWPCMFGTTPHDNSLLSARRLRIPGPLGHPTKRKASA